MTHAILTSDTHRDLRVRTDRGAALGDAVMTRTLGDRENRIMLRADRDVIYGNVMRVMNVLQDYGFYKVALVAEEVV